MNLFAIGISCVLYQESIVYYGLLIDFINGYRLFLYAGAFVCNISSPSFNTIRVSCELLGILVRVNVILNCISCIGSHAVYTITDDSPIVVRFLPAGNHTVNVTAVDISNDIIKTVEVIVMSEDVTIDMSPTSGPANTATTHDLPTNITTTTTTIITVSTTMNTNSPTTIDELSTNRAATNAPTTESKIPYSYIVARTGAMNKKLVMLNTYIIIMYTKLHVVLRFTQRVITSCTVDELKFLIMVTIWLQLFCSLVIITRILFYQQQNMW